MHPLWWTSMNNDANKIKFHGGDLLRVNTNGQLNAGTIIHEVGC